MELHGGEISVTSEGLGKGTCFSVELPLASNQTITDTPLNTDLRASTATHGSQHLRARSKAENVITMSFCDIVRCLARSRCLIWRFQWSSNRVEVDSESNNAESHVKRCHPNDLSINFQQELDYQRDIIAFDHAANDVVIEASHNDKIIESKDDTMKKAKRKGCVLIVDDVPMNRKMLKRLLAARFDECLEAENGQEAVDMVKEAMACGKSFDFITMDYQMPVVDGVTATCSLRKLGFKGQIIGVTDNALSEDVDTFLANGANFVLTKPLSIQKLDEYIDTVSRS